MLALCEPRAELYAGCDGTQRRVVGLSVKTRSNTQGKAARKDKTVLQNRIRKEKEQLHRSCKRPGRPAASRAESCPETLRINNRARSTAPTPTGALPAGPYRGVPPHTRGSPRAPR